MESDTVDLEGSVAELGREAGEEERDGKCWQMGMSEIRATSGTLCALRPVEHSHQSVCG